MEPGHIAAISLLQFSSAVGLIDTAVDPIVGLLTLVKLVDEVEEAFTGAHWQLEEDERKFPELGRETQQP